MTRLFSKLFSRGGDQPTGSDDQDAQAEQPGEDGVKTSDGSGSSGGSPKDPQARAAAERANPAPPKAAGDKASKARTEAGLGVQLPPQKRAGAPLDASDPAGKAGKKNEPLKRDAKPPAAAGAAAVATPARAPQPAAVVPPPPSAANDPNAARRSPPPIRHGIGGTRPATEGVLQTKVIGAPPSAANDAAVLPLEAAVDAAMAAILQSNPPQAATGHHAIDQHAVAETFADIAKAHAHPLRELMFQLSVGRTSRQWAAACRPVLRPLFEAATQIGLLELVGALGAFDAALERAAGEPSAFIGDGATEALSAAYERLRQHMPDAFTPPAGADSRRLILLESLLLQIPELHRRTRAKLYAAGLASLAQLGTARADEIAVVAGIDLGLAQTVVDHVQRFEQRRSNADPAGLRSHAQDRLRAILVRLSQLQADFERAEQDDSVTGKRNARRDREATVLELDLVFAELGELDVIEELKRCPVRDKIERVESYLERLQASA